MEMLSGAEMVVRALEDDLIYYLPIRQYIAERIRAGEWPLWNRLTPRERELAI